VLQNNVHRFDLSSAAILRFVHWASKHLLFLKLIRTCL
jgi:hypothetical protein